MATYEPWSVVVVPFPFVDRRQAKRRPAVVLSPMRFQADHRSAVLAMITDARNPRWPSDVRIRDLRAAGLRFASVVRCKLFTLDSTFVLSRIGTLASGDRRAVGRALRAAIVR
jgi:mRNA interferase MazF